MPDSILLTHLHYYSSLILIFLLFIYVVYDCLFLFRVQQSYRYLFEKKIARINIVNLLNSCFAFIITYYMYDLWWKQVSSYLFLAIWSFTNSYLFTMLYYRYYGML